MQTFPTDQLPVAGNSQPDTTSLEAQEQFPLHLEEAGFDENLPERYNSAFHYVMQFLKPEPDRYADHEKHQLHVRTLSHAYEVLQNLKNSL